MSFAGVSKNIKITVNFNFYQIPIFDCALEYGLFHGKNTMKTAKKSDRKQRVAVNTQINEMRHQVSSNWHDMKTKLDKVLSNMDENNKKK